MTETIGSKPGDLKKWVSVTTTRPAHASSTVGEQPIKCGLKDGHAQKDQFLFDALSENYSFSSMVASASQRKNWSFM